MGISELIKERNKRYIECDREGHKKPNHEEKRCDYCYRTLNPTDPQTIAIDMKIGLNCLEKELGISMFQ